MYDRKSKGKTGKQPKYKQTKGNKNKNVCEAVGEAERKITETKNHPIVASSQTAISPWALVTQSSIIATKKKKRVACMRHCVESPKTALKI